jgi:acetyl-CoA synthetase
MLVTQAASYAEVYNTFRWALPERYNIAWDVCDRHAGLPDKLALIHQQPDGAIRHYTFREMQRYANQLANVFLASELIQGDRVKFRRRYFSALMRLSIASNTVARSC